MVFTYLLATDIGKVRLLVPDNKVASYIFEDDEITAMLMARAARLREQAAAAAVTGLFDYAEMVTNPFSMRERLDAEALRDA